MSLDTALYAVKQAILPSTKFFDFVSLQPPTSIDELFQRGNQYVMLKDDVKIATKRTVASTFDTRAIVGAKERAREADGIKTPSRNRAMVSWLTLQVTRGQTAQATGPQTL